MRKGKKYLKQLKRNKLRNKKLIKKFPWLLPRNVLTNKPLDDYNYEFTLYDDIPSGWAKAFGMMICKEIQEELEKNNLVNTYSIQQIKEKYGELRWYSNGTEKIYNIIDKYSTLSANICICCGKPDVPYLTTGWIMPICEKCYYKKFRNPREYKEICSEDYRMSDSLSYKKFSKEGESLYVTSIKETADKIRHNWNKKHKAR